MLEVAFTTYSGIWIPATFNTGTERAGYPVLNGNIPKVARVESVVSETKLDIPTAALYVGILLTLIGFVLGIAYPQSGVAVLFPVGLSMIWALARFTRTRGEPLE
jgi:hypothetical protein